MLVINMRALREVLAPGQRLLGLDLGSKTVGVALTDVSLLVATPFGTRPRGNLSMLAAWLRRIAQARGVGGLVVGWPLSMDGSVGPAAQSARDVAHALARALDLPAVLWDERLSTAAVNRVLIDEADVSRRRRAAVVDAMAATYILQSALNASRD